MRPCLALVLIVPLAGASGEFSAGPAVVTLDNGHSQQCLDQATGLCLASANLSSEGPSADARQQLSLLSVAVDTSSVSEVVGLPGGELVITPTAVPVPTNGYAVIGGASPGFAVPTPIGTILLQLNETAVTTGYPQPTGDPNGSFEDRPRHIDYPDTGPGPDAGNTSTDRAIDGPRPRQCDLAWGAVCGVYDSSADVIEASTPNAIVGFGLYRAVVNESSSRLNNGDHGLDRRPTAERIAMRSTALPTKPLPDSDLGRHALPHGGGRTSSPTSSWEFPRTPDTPAIRIAGSVADPLTTRALAPPLALTAAFALAVALAAFYARISSREEVLSGTRAEIMDRLSRNGPTALALLARELGLDRSTVEYHARALESAGFVVARVVARKRILALPGQQWGPERRGHTRDIIIELLRAHAGSLPRDELHRLASASAIPLRTQNGALGDLRAKGLIELVHGDGAPLVRIRGGVASADGR